MNTKRRFLILAGGMLALSACGIVPQNAVITPQVNVAKTASGGNSPVVLQVVDERPGTMIGNRAPMGAEVRLADVTPVIEPRIRDALVTNDFRPVGATEAAERALKVEVRAVELKSAAGFFTGGYFPSAAFKVVATNKGQTFDRLYRAEQESRSVVVNAEDRNNRLLSEVVSKALSDLVNDPELMGFLAR